jgi:hypothetical protein
MMVFLSLFLDVADLEQSMVWFNHSGARTYSSLVFDVTRGQLIVAAR